MAVSACLIVALTGGDLSLPRQTSWEENKKRQDVQCLHFKLTKVYNAVRLEKGRGECLICMAESKKRKN